MSSPQADVAILIGRFQPFHHAHLALLQRALEVAPLCVVVIGSAHQARSPKNPFTWTERAEMIRLALPEADRERVRLLPVRDHYDEVRWVRAVHEGVVALLGGTRCTNIALVGHFKDATSQYLRGFPGWSLISVGRLPGADGTHLRDALFGAAPEDIDATLGALVDQAPPSTLAFLRAWAALPFAAELATEWQMLRDYRATWGAPPHRRSRTPVDRVRGECC